MAILLNSHFSHDSRSELSVTNADNAPLLEPTGVRPESITSSELRAQRKIGLFHFHGWRVGVIICTSTATVVLIANIVLTIWACTKNGLRDGIGTIQDGSCQDTKDLSLWLHLLINALSTILLAASNYCMQCLSSPTREEIDKAHSRHIWLDIGVPSFRNLHCIAGNRLLLWWLLAFSGIPLHLLYNSAVFSTLSAQQYTTWIGTDELINNYSNNETYTRDGVSYFEIYYNASTWQNLSNAECIRAYGQPFVSKRSDVLAVASNVNLGQPVMGLNPAGVISYNWMCSSYKGLRGKQEEAVI